MKRPLPGLVKAVAHRAVKGNSLPRDLRKSLLIWAAVGLAIRLFIAPFTSHPYDMGSWIVHQDRFFHAGLNPLFAWKFSVPLLALLLSMFGPSRLTSSILGSPHVLGDQFFIKLPFVLADVGIAVVLGTYVWLRSGSRRDAKTATLLWVFSPVAIFYSAVHGQWDALPSFFILLGVLMVEKERVGRGFGCLLGAGLAKYYGFLLMPLLWVLRLGQPDYVRKNTWRLIAVSAVVILVGYPTLVTAYRSHLFGGLSSSLAAGSVTDDEGFWSLFAHPLLGSFRSGWWWIAAFLLLYLVVLVGIIRRVGSSQRSILFLCASATVLGFLIALAVRGSPQFIIWVLPLFISLAIVTRSMWWLGLTLLAGGANLLSFWISENPLTWTLNAVPMTEALRDGVLAPFRTPDLEVARLAGFVYALTVLFMSLWALRLLFRRRSTLQDYPENEHSALRKSWRRATQAALLVAILPTVGLAGFLFQPALAQNYRHAPQYPVDLDRLSLFPAESVRWTSRPQGRLLATWSDEYVDFLRSTLDRSSLVIQSQLSPVVAQEGASIGDPVDDDGSTEQFILGEASTQLHMQILLGTERANSPIEDDLPRLVLSSSASSRSIPMRVEVQSEVAPGWFLIHAWTLDPSDKGRYTLEISDSGGPAWFWNAGPARSSTRGRAGGGGEFAHWLRVWTAGLPLPEGSEILVQSRLSDAGGLEFRMAPVTVPDLKRFEVTLPPSMRSQAKPSISVYVDMKRSPLWRSNSPLSLYVFLGGMLSILLLAVGVARLMEWAWQRPR